MRLRLMALAALLTATATGLAPALDDPPAKKPKGAGQGLENNLKIVALGLHNYESAYGKLPASAGLAGKAGKPLLSWRVAILPYIEHERLFKQFKTDEPFDSPHNAKVVADNPMPKEFESPGVETPSKKTRLQGFVSPAGGKGAQPMFEPARGVSLLSITDGTSNTILVAIAAEPVEWAKPADIPFAPGADLRKLVHFAPDGPAHVVMGDGAALKVKAGVTAKVFEALVTRNGGEVVQPAEWLAK